MKILLAVPPKHTYIEASAHRKVEKKREHRPMLGIFYIASYLKAKQEDVQVKVLDCPAEDIDLIQYRHIVKSFKPDLVGMTALTFTIVDALKAAEATKEISPGTFVCIGGFHSTLYPRETLMQPGVDFVVFGEGELTFDTLVREMKRPDPVFNHIQGLGFRRGSDVTINSHRPLIECLDALPFPDYNLVDIKKYAHVLGKSAVTISLQSSRGCPFGCIFCDIRRSKFRFRSAESIVEEISCWYKKGIRSFFIVDDNFIIKRHRLNEICSRLHKLNMKIDFKISARVDSVDREVLLALKKAGCSRINFGVESGHQKYLDYLEKGFTHFQTETAFRLCHEIGINAFAYMMIGLPGETIKEMYDELAFLRNIKADYASFSVCSPYPKTRLYEKLLDEKIITHDYWQEFAENPTGNFVMPLIPELYSQEELRYIQSDMTRDFYMSGRMMLQKLKEIKNFRQFLNIVKLGWQILRPTREVTIHHA